MTVQAIRFNKTTLANLVAAGQSVMRKDTMEKGLRFKVGARRSVFQFEKRIRGRKGSPITITIGAFPTVSIAEARQEARRLANLCEKGLDPRYTDQKGETPVITLETAISKFFEVKITDLKPRTLRKYRDLVHNHFPKKWMDQDITAITAEMLVEQFHESRKRARVGCWEFLKMYNTIWNTCQRFFFDGRGQRILKFNPTGDARAMLNGVSRNKPRRSVIRADQLGIFVAMVERLAKNDYAHSHGKQAMCYIALICLFTGFRFVEAQHLKWEYIDLDNGNIRLPGSKTDDSFGGTKNHCEHWVSLSTYVWDILRTLHEKRDTESPYVFHQVKNRLKPVNRDYAVFARITEMLGSHYSPHTSRRTFASVAGEVGIKHLTIKRMLNHEYQGDVTGKYIVPGFNPGKSRCHFQKVCDFILDRRAEYLGEKAKVDDAFNEETALLSLKRHAVALGIDLERALAILTRKAA